MISVCMATYNGERYIKEQIDSILFQLAETDELIVSDDNSTDFTIDILKSYNDSRLKIFQNLSKPGIIGNFENAIRMANGEYIFLADQDDIWDKTKVETCVSFFKQGFNMVISDAFIINENGNIIGESFYKIVNSGTGLLKNFSRNSYLGCCMAIDRKVLDCAIPFPDKIAMHDIWLGLVTEVFAKSIFIPDKLVFYRRHGNNNSPTGEKSIYNIAFRVSYRLYLVYVLFKRYLNVFFGKTEIELKVK